MFEPMPIWAWPLLLPLAGLTLFTVLNAPQFKRLSAAKRRNEDPQPLVSLLIPARQEERNLAALLPSLQQQSYQALEVIVFDDHSSDRTFEVATAFARSDPRFRVIQGQSLPHGWLGKPNACQKLFEAANGELLVFTDADTLWHKDTVQLVVNAFNRTRCDALSGWPGQVLTGWFSSIIQPFLAWSLVAFLPMSWVPNPKFPGTVSANGQLIAFKRRTLEQVGGFASVRDNILEDMLLAKAIKRAGMHFEFFNARDAISCAMYSSSKDAFMGFTKAAYTNVGSSVLNLTLAIFGFSWGFVLPWLWLLLAWLNGQDLIWPSVAVALGVLGRAASDAQFGFPIWLALTQPLAVIAWVSIALVSYWQHRVGAVRWKGRTYPTQVGRQNLGQPESAEG